MGEGRGRVVVMEGEKVGLDVVMVSIISGICTPYLW